MNKIAAIAVLLFMAASSTAFGQDAMRYGVKHLTVLAEDQKVRVLRYAPKKGDKTPIHSHPSTVVYVLKGGRVKYTEPRPPARSYSPIARTSSFTLPEVKSFIALRRAASSASVGIGLATAA